MNKTPLLIFSLTFLSVAGIKSDFLRLNKFIYTFEYPNYRQSDRDIFLNGSYEANIEETFPTPSVHEYVLDQNFDRNGNGQTGLLLRQIKSSPVNRTDRSLSVTANGKLHEKSFIYRNELLGTEDTTAVDSSYVKAGINYTFSREKQFGRQGLRNWLFWGVNGNFELFGEDERRKDFHSDNDNGIFKDSRMEIDQSINSELSINPSLGFGRKRPARPVYQAFLIEHKLKKSGCLKGNLSDSTMYRLGELASSVEAYQRKNEKHVKFLMSDVEKIILKDSAVVDSSLDAFALFRLHEVFETELPFFFCGPSVSITWPVYYIGRWESWYDSREDHTNFAGFIFDGMTEIPYFNLEYTFPLVTTLFAELKVGLPLNLIRTDFTILYG